MTNLEKRVAKMEQAAEKMLARHRAADAAPAAPETDREARTLERLQREAKQLRASE